MRVSDRREREQMLSPPDGDRQAAKQPRTLVLQRADNWDLPGAVRPQPGRPCGGLENGWMVGSLENPPGRSRVVRTVRPGVALRRRYPRNALLRIVLGGRDWRTQSP